MIRNLIEIWCSLTTPQKLVVEIHLFTGILTCFHMIFTISMFSTELYVHFIESTELHFIENGAPVNTTTPP